MRKELPKLCTRIKTPLNEPRARICGRPAIYAVGEGKDVRHRCNRCVSVARQRGEKITRLDGRTT